MTPKEALALATKAHKGQYRRMVVLSFIEAKKLVGMEILDRLAKKPESEIELSDGGLIGLLDQGKFLYSAPYISHPITVASLLTGDDAKIVAYLHDVIEDTDADLTFNGRAHCIIYDKEVYIIERNIYNALSVLTKGKDQNYDKYIEGIAEDYKYFDKLSMRVKLADITANLTDSPTDRQKKKYRTALQQLISVI